MPDAELAARDIPQMPIAAEVYPPAPRLEKDGGAGDPEMDASKIEVPSTTTDPVSDVDPSAAGQAVSTAPTEPELTPMPDAPVDAQPVIANVRVGPVATEAFSRADPAPRRRGGALALLVGGVVAASAGFLAAQYADPKGWPFAVGDAANDLVAVQGGRIDGIEAQIAALKSDMDATLQAGLAAADARTQTAVAEALAPIDARITQSLSEGDSRIAALGAAVGALADRMTEVEKLPIDANAAAEAAVAAYEREVATIRAEIDEVIARNNALQSQMDDVRAETEAAERLSAARVALGQIEAALENGGAYGAAVRNIAAAGAEVPAPLADHAASGVPSQSVLTTTFAPAARNALDAALRDVSDLGTGERLWSFVRAQLGARSLAARDGDGADAILSRAEAALRTGDLDTALAEIAALPDEARSHMSAWAAQAEIRRAALAAMSALSTNVASL
jgi:hypothetical protein